MITVMMKTMMMIVVMMIQIPKIYSEFLLIFIFFLQKTMSVIEEIKKKIAEKPVFIISKEYCPFCVKAKDAFKNYKIKPECIEIMEIENNPHMDEIQVCSANFVA